MEELKNAIKVIQAYGEALKNAVDKTVDYLPILTYQHIKTKANQKLQSTKDQYLDAVKVDLKGDVLLVELDPSNWVANAVESGADPFNMKESLLTGPKARISKKGFLYNIIPISKDPSQKSGTTKGQEYQKKIQKAMDNPAYGKTMLRYLPSGKVAEMQEIITGDMALSGLYRTRTYDSAKAMSEGGNQKWSLVMFRVVSSNPASLSQWDHPGIKPQHIFKDTERWLNNNLEDIFEGFLQEELDLFLK